MEEIIQFIDGYLTSFIHHRNQLRHYRSTIKTFRDELEDAIWIDVDLAENLNVPVKEEPQSLHWAQVTVHSGISKVNGIKMYHPFLSSDRDHDQQIVAVSIKKIIDCTKKEIEEDNQIPDVVVIESDNANQYKYTEHFNEIQKICNQENRHIIRVYGIAQHRKGEVDHVGGISKEVIRAAIAKGEVFEGVEEMAGYIQDKFKDKAHPKYNSLVVTEEELGEARKQANKFIYMRIDGSRTIQVAVFSPHSSTIRIAPRLCICHKCKES